jgi:hypothetical protein
MDPVSATLLHFSGEDLERLRTHALTDISTTRRDISRLDVILSHLWRAINRARYPSGCEADSSSQDNSVFLDVTLGARTRISPPLPQSFVGSPLFMTHIGSSISEVCSSGIGGIASRLRETINLFTADAVMAILHAQAHEVAPQRLWQGFMGSRHILVTSWQRLQAYDVNFFGTGTSVNKENDIGKPVYVHAYMPKVDGILVVMESRLDKFGADVCLYLDANAMERFLDAQEYEIGGLEELASTN